MALEERSGKFYRALLVRFNHPYYFYVRADLWIGIACLLIAAGLAAAWMW